MSAIAVSILAVVRLASSIGPRLGLTAQRALRLAVIAAATAGLAGFQVTTGMAGTHFAWDSPYIAVNAAHARAITAIIGDHNRDRGRAVVSVEPEVLGSIEKSTGVKIEAHKRGMNLSSWWMTLSFWSGREVIVIGAESPPAAWARYRVSLAHPGADPGTTYHVGADSFEVQTAPDR